MRDASQKRGVRLGILGLGREHLDLLPALYRDERVEVAWVYAGNAEATVARLGSLFSFPAVEHLNAEALAGVDVLIRPAAEAPQWDGQLPGELRVLTDAELTGLRQAKGFRWEEIMAAPGTGPAEPGLEQETAQGWTDHATAAVEEEVAPAGSKELTETTESEADEVTLEPRPTQEASGATEVEPDHLPKWFVRLLAPQRLGAWICRRLDEEAGGTGHCLLLLIIGGRCVGTYRAGGRMDGSFRRAACRLARALPTSPTAIGADWAEAKATAIDLSSLPSAALGDCGLAPGPAWLLTVALGESREARLLVPDPRGEALSAGPDGGLRRVHERLRAELELLRGLAHLALQASHARDWRQLRSLWQRL